MKVAKEQGLCIPGSKVLIFTSENEGKKNENVTFKVVDIEWATLWLIYDDRYLRLYFIIKLILP